MLAKLNTDFAVPLIDSIKVTKLKVKELTDTLAIQETLNYQSLICSIKFIGAKYKTLDSLFMPDASLIIPTNDDQLTILAKLIVPIIEKKWTRKQKKRKKIFCWQKLI